MSLEHNTRWLLGACLAVAAGCSSTVAGGMGPDDDNGGGGFPDATPTEDLPDAGETPDAGSGVTTLTQSTGAPVANANVNCRYGEQGPHADTRHFRVFPAASIGGSTITEVTLPIEVADAPDGPQTATLTIHRLTGNILAGGFEPTSVTPFQVPNQVLGEVKVPVSVAVGETDDIVIEVSMPDGEQLRNLRFGHNLEPQTAPTYYASNACGQANPIDLATLDNPFVPGTTFAANSWLVSLTIER